MLYYPEKCLRDRDDCEPLSQICSDEEPFTFICVGRNDGRYREEPQDEYRLCVTGCGGTCGVDQIADVDRRDLADQLSVIAHALCMIENERPDDREQDDG